MISIKSHLKKIIVGVLAIIAISLALISPARADAGTDAILNDIRTYTFNILAAVNGLPTFIANWINPDTSDTTATLQGYFSNASTGYIQDYNTNLYNTQNKLLADFFGTGSAAPQNVNDLSYLSILGPLYISPDPRKADSIDPAYNYTKNAAALGITHPKPDVSWNGSDTAVKRYISYYNTVSSAQTFDAWVLGQTYTELKSGFPFAKQQWNLIAQASNSNWFSQVASENIGIVLRQILMYDSQILVALTEMMRIQKEQLTAQAITNSLLVLNNLQNENYLVLDAKGKIPSQAAQ